MFVVMVDKAKIVEEVRDRERSQVKGKKDLGSSGSIQCLKKWVIFIGPFRIEASIASNEISRCVDYRKCHSDKC